MKQLSQIAISFLVIASMLTGMDKPSLSLEKLIENNARQLRIFVAKEQRGTYCPELYKAQELLKPYACEIENQPWTPLGAFICNIVDKSGYYNKLISILKHEHPHDIPHMCRQLLKENRYAINIYGSAQPYEDRIITPLHYALAMHAPRELQESTLVFCKTFLSLGANPNARDDAGNTPLHHASTVEQVQLLCDYGAKLNKKGESGRTPLLNSIRLRNWKVAQCLLEYGANPHKKDKNNNSPFYKALKKKADPAFIQLLLNKDVNCIICRKGKTIADLADARIMEMIRKHVISIITSPIKDSITWHAYLEFYDLELK